MRMTRRIARIGDPVGLHLRAASRIVRAAKSFECEIDIAYAGVVANAKSILGLASLVAPHLAPVEILAKGPDAEQAVAHLFHLIEVELATDEAGGSARP